SSAMDAVAYRAALGLLSETELRERVTRLAAIERGSASPGEREAAELIAAELRESGARVRLEEEPAHGTYWWPVGLLTGAAAAAGPLLAAAGALAGLRLVRLAGAVLSGGYAAAMVDIGSRGVVPGANDNLTGVAVLLSLARAYADDPPDGARMVLLSTGSEESFMEGMQGFARRHFGTLPRETTSFVCIDTVGSPDLLVVPA